MVNVPYCHSCNNFDFECTCGTSRTIKYLTPHRRPPNPPAADATLIPLRIGDAVCKAKGFKFNGYIVGDFRNRAGERRVVVEHATETGMLHIYNPDQLVRRA